jgi:hypothetical protein
MSPPTAREHRGPGDGRPAKPVGWEEHSEERTERGGEP